MIDPTPPIDPRPDAPRSDGPAPTDAEARLLAQLDAALAPAASPAGLADAVLAATRDRLPAAGAGGGDGARLLAQLDAALAPAALPAGLADAVLAATRDRLPAAGGADDDAQLAYQLDAALARAASPAGLADAVLAATRDHLPAAAPAGRIGFGRVGWMRALAAAALVAVAAGAWWISPSGDGPAVAPGVATNRTPDPTPPIQTATIVDTDLDPEAARLLEPFEALDNRLAWAAGPDETAADPVDLLGKRLAAVADAGPWSGSGFDGIDRAIDWEVSFETADDGAWLF